MAPILTTTLALNQFLGSQTIHQFDGGVVRDPELFGKLTDGQAFPFGESFNGE